MAESQIIAISGGMFPRDDAEPKLARFVLDCSGKEAPRVCYIPTASGDNSEFIATCLASYARLGVSADVLRFFDRTPANLAEFLAPFDIVQVSGGNTRSMLAVWRHWGLDVVLKDAFDRGVLLCGASAGSLCWFKNGLTDSVAESYTSTSGLGFLDGSNCAHYDIPDRRLAYREMIARGELSAGIAFPDGVAAYYRAGKFFNAVSLLPDLHAYYVEQRDGKALETALPTTTLP
jgi:dipeptidase E